MMLAEASRAGPRWLELTVILVLVSGCCGAARDYQHDGLFGIEPRYSIGDVLPRFSPKSLRRNVYSLRVDDDPEPVQRGVKNANPTRSRNSHLRRYIDDFELDEGLDSWNGDGGGKSPDTLASFLEELAKRRRANGQFFGDDMVDFEVNDKTGSRGGRRRKLTSHEQGILLVETLRKKRNYTSPGVTAAVNDYRGHGANNAVQSGIMDMLGRSRNRPIFFVVPEAPGRERGEIDIFYSLLVLFICIFAIVWIVNSYID